MAATTSEQYLSVPSSPPPSSSSLLSLSPSRPTWFARKRKYSSIPTEPLFPVSTATSLSSSPSLSSTSSSSSLSISLPVCYHFDTYADTTMGVEICLNCSEQINVLYDYRPVQLYEDDSKDDEVKADKITERAVENGSGSSITIVSSPLLQTVYSGGKREGVSALNKKMKSSQRTGGGGNGSSSVVIKNECTMKLITAHIYTLLQRLGISTTGDIVTRALQLAQLFVNHNTIHNKQTKYSPSIAAAAVSRVVGERYMGYCRDEIMARASVDFNIPRIGEWKLRLSKALHLPELDRGRSLDGFLTRYMGLQQLPLIEQDKIKAVASWVKFMMWFGDHFPLPVVGSGGSPYSNPTNHNGPWASKLFQSRIEGKEEEKKKKEDEDDDLSTRKNNWLTPLCSIGRVVVEETNNMNQQYKLWSKEVMSIEAIRVLSLPEVPPKHREPLWPLNKRNIAIIAITIIWLVGQLRTCLPKKNQKRSSPKPVKINRTVTKVLHRPTQKETCSQYGISRKSLARAKHAMRDMYYCFM